MKKISFEFEVETSDDGHIFINQNAMGDDNSICLLPDQIDTLIEYLQEAKKELTQRD